MTYEIVLFLHVIGAIILVGTGAGIAFFMVVSNRSNDPKFIAHVSGIVVLADTVFTATAAIAQPITGLILTRQLGWSLWESWIVLSLGLYVVIGVFWLPVVWMQAKMRDLASGAAAANLPLPERYHRLYRIWFSFGFPAFTSIIVIVWLMLTKPTLW